MQRLQVVFDAPRVSDYKPRHEAEDRIVDLAGLCDGYDAPIWIGSDLLGPSATEGKLGIGDSCHQPVRWRFLDAFVYDGLPVLVDFFPSPAAIARGKFLRTT